MRSTESREMNAYPPSMTTTTPPQRVGFRLPLAQPRWTYALLGLNVLIWLAMGVAGFAWGFGLNGSQSNVVLLLFGAQRNSLIAQGQYWRLVTSMFLHIGLMHLLFNVWALYVLGRDVEALYGSSRFLTIYLLSGIGGSLSSYLLGDDYVSAGASGAIFGLIGASIAYFALHRDALGQRGQQQLRSLLTIAAINLFIGFTVPGINNLAHGGGLIFGVGLGWLLAPRYAAPPVLVLGGVQTLVDRNSLRRRLPALALVILLMALMGVAGTTRWASSPQVLFEKARDLMDAGDYQGAAADLRSLAEHQPENGAIFFYLGVAEANLRDLEAAARAWERSVELEPDIAFTRWNLALAYQKLERPDDAIAQLREYARLAESDEERARAEALIRELGR